VNPSPARRAAYMLAGYVLTWAALVGVGLLITKVVTLSGEASIEHGLADHRTGLWNTITHWITLTAETPTVVVAVAVIAIVLRWRLHRWREPLFLVFSVSAQALIFLLVQLLIDRPRPDVPHLDAAPPTSSFPSGHTGASTALWLSLAAVAAIAAARPWVRRTLVICAIAVPLAVATARVYRGMHHPTDVVLGVLNGLTCMLITYHGMRRRDGSDRIETSEGLRHAHA
jgi:membrane-associated phospholipid phosphatase